MVADEKKVCTGRVLRNGSHLGNLRGIPTINTMIRSKYGWTQVLEVGLRLLSFALLLSSF